MASGKVVRSAVFLFLSGAVFGAVALHVFMRFVFFSHHRQPLAPVDALIEHLDRELSLSVEQAKELRRIATATREKLDTVRQKSQPQIETIINAAEKEAELYLKPRQQARLRELQQFAKEHFRNPPAPPPDGPPPGPPGPPF